MRREQENRDFRDYIARRLSRYGELNKPSVDHLVDDHLDAMMLEFSNPSKRAATHNPRESFTFSRRRGFGAISIAAIIIIGVPTLAIAGALPRPIQDAAAEVAESFGLDIPRGKSVAASYSVGQRPMVPQSARTTHRAEAPRVSSSPADRRKSQSPLNEPTTDPRTSSSGRPALDSNPLPLHQSSDAAPSSAPEAKRPPQQVPSAPASKIESPPPRTDIEPNPSSGGKGNAGGNGNGNGNGNAGGNTNSNAGGNSNGNAGGNANSNAGGNSNGNAGGNANSNAGGNGNGNAGGNGKPKS